MAKSTQAQINELRRTIEKQRVSHKLLKTKVTHMASRVRTLEPFLYAEERDLLCLYLYEFREFLEKKEGSRGNKNWPKETWPTRAP
jgi:hypothetical protein